MNANAETRLFIGSSTEGLDIANTIQEALDFDCESRVWTQGVFEPSRTAIENLMNSLKQFDFAAFVFSADDVTRLRGHEHRTVRDNVVFEFGLFAGRLGIERCFMVQPRSVNNFLLPTDLSGLEPLTFRDDRSDGNLLAALGPPCNKMRRLFRALGRSDKGVETKSESGGGPYAFDTYVQAWNSSPLVEHRERIRALAMDPYDPEAAEQKPHFEAVYAFLDGLADTVLSGHIDENRARREFGAAISSVWQAAYTRLAPVNQADEWWDELPPIAQLADKWR